MPSQLPDVTADARIEPPQPPADATKPGTDAGTPDAPPASPPPDAAPPPPSCNNQRKDGDETDLDCGGPECAPCSDDQACVLGRDCTSGVCGDNLQCASARCGDGVVNGDDVCDDNGESAECDTDCTPRECGDGTVNTTAGEECDNGPENRDEPNQCRTNCKLPACGDNIIDNGENVDPPISPSPVVPVDTDTCRFDLSNMQQMYCQADCGTVWDGERDCQESDADVLCKLITGNPNSQATDYVVLSALQMPGVCCPPPELQDPTELDCVALGNMSDRGVDVNISIHETDLSDSHGTGGVVAIASPDDCTNP